MSSKRIVVVSSVPTEPPVAGNRTRTRRLVADLHEMGHEVHLLLIPDSPGDLDAMRVQMQGRLRLLENPRPPFRNPLRFRLLNRLTAGHVMGPRFQYLRNVDAFVSERLERDLARLAREIDPDAVIASYPFYSRVLDHFGEHTFKILDTHDRFTRRHWLQWRHRMRTRFVAMSARQERRALERADLVLAIQEQECRFFQRLARTPAVTLGHRVELQRLPLPSGDGPPRIAFAGSDNGPNVGGINWFVARVLPGLRRRHPDLELLLAGPICSCPGLVPGPGVRLLGVLDDLTKLYEQADVMVNPAFAGTGLHLKNVEAMGHGRPIVMTRIATRGIREEAGRAYRVANGARAFYREIGRLLRDRAAAEALADEAYRFAERYDRRVERQLESILARV